jgi:hypothetical protein
MILPCDTGITIASYIVFGAGTAFLVRADQHTDDTGLLVGCIGILAFLLGALHPKRAWQWPLLIAVSIVGAEIWALMSRVHHVKQQTAINYVLIGAFITAIGMAASYAGVGLRRVMRSSAA